MRFIILTMILTIMNTLLNVRSGSSTFMFSWACYPILGALLVLSSVWCYEHIYHYRTDKYIPLEKNHQPMITIFVPAHNEQTELVKTVTYLATKLTYDNYEIIIGDDGSTDNTPILSDELAIWYHNVRVIHMKKNAGKAHFYNVALGFAKGKYIYSNDADTIPERDCLEKYMTYFIGHNHQNVGAVTGNIDVINRSRSICKAQVAEFTSIIGSIKRGQSAYAGTQYAFSGACLMIRKDALIDVGGFSQSLATEDIDLAWRMSRNGWESLFAPNIFSYTLAPTTFKQLFKQRKRWAAGGTEVWLLSFKLLIDHPWLMRDKIPIFIDATVSNTWSFLYWLLLILFTWDTIYDYHFKYWTDLKYLWLFMLCIVCIEFILGSIQISTSLHYDDNGKKWKYISFCPMYLVFTWIIDPLTVVLTFPKAVKVILGHENGNTWSNSR